MMLGNMRGLKWVLLFPLVFAGISCNAGHAKSALLIKNDGGGDIIAYVARYLNLQLSGEQVVFDGDCLSACTLALGLLARDQRCFTKQARLGFHEAYTDYGSTRQRNHIGTAIFWLIYPTEIRRWLSKHGGLTSKVTYLEGKELAAMYQPCRRQIRSDQLRKKESCQTRPRATPAAGAVRQRTDPPPITSA
jgi:hypothetical protein